MKRKAGIVLVAALIASGCYKATVRTGINAGPDRVERSMAFGDISGLVPPGDVDGAEDCGDRGVAVVETKLSFLNQLVGFLTLGIYTPMSITVTCGEGSSDEEGVEDEEQKADGTEKASAGRTPSP